MPVNIGGNIVVGRKRGMQMGGGGGLLPFSDDFERADGAVGGPWLNTATWQIVSGAAINTPTLGAELLTDPGLEATYTGGKCDTLTIDVGTWTLTQSADVHGGSAAQAVTATSANGTIRWPRPTLVAKQWYEGSIWAKRTAGATGTERVYFESSGQKPNSTMHRQLADAGYTRIRQVFRAASATVLGVYLRDGGPTYDTVIVDDGSVKAMSLNTMYQVIAAGPGVTARAAVVLTEGLVGVVSHLDDYTTPQNGIFAYIYRSNIYFYCIVEKLLAGVWSTVLVETFINAYTLAGGSKIFELRYKSANTFGAYYDNVQLGGDLTISDASIVSNRYAGPLAAGGSTVQSFFAAAA